jgi:hypothetical protein
MSDTPRTDAAYTLSTGAGIYELFKESQDIERELNAANQRIKRLEELGHKLRECASQIGWTSSEDPRWLKRAEAAVEAWDKEAKP